MLTVCLVHSIYLVALHISVLHGKFKTRFRSQFFFCKIRKMDKGVIDTHL